MTRPRGKRLVLSDDEYWTYRGMQGLAVRLLGQALGRKELSRPDTCELCGNIPNKENPQKSLIVAHHWNGYDNPLDIWWICRRCNNLLMGPEFHNGSVSKEEARAIIASRAG